MPLQEPWLYDIESDPLKVNAFLNDLYDRLIECQNRAKEFKDYQKEFRVSIQNYLPLKF